MKAFQSLIRNAGNRVMWLLLYTVRTVRNRLTLGYGYFLPDCNPTG